MLPYTASDPGQTLNKAEVDGMVRLKNPLRTYIQTAVGVESLSGLKREKKKKVGENNGQLHFIRHHGWRTQTRLDQFIKQITGQKQNVSQ